MRYTILITVISLLIVNFSFGQNTAQYNDLKNDAWTLYQAKEYQKSADKYKEALDLMGENANMGDRYNASCSFALAEDYESSFFHLFELANGKHKFTNLNHIISDGDLNSLHIDKRWEELIAIIQVNKDKAEINFDKPLVKTLEKIRIEDQQYRRQIKDIEDEYGWQSDEMKAHWKLIDTKDSINLIQIEKILSERGWLGEDVIGKQGNSTLFLVIQHADHQTQLKYIPMMREAVENGNARGSSLALLEDRVALKNGDWQIYGSQIWSDSETNEKYVAPIVDPDNVDKRRAEVGLGPLADYVKHWNMTWDIEKHKKRSAKIKTDKEAKTKSSE